MKRQYMRLYNGIRCADLPLAPDSCGLKTIGQILELGTGTGLSTSWILDEWIIIPHWFQLTMNPGFWKLPKDFWGMITALNLMSADAGKWVENNRHQKFDYIFADTWHGKYLLLDEVLSMLNKGGLYIIDDMLPQPNWPEGHQEKAIKLVDYFRNKRRFIINQAGLGYRNNNCS